MLSLTDLAVTVAEADAYVLARAYAGWTVSEDEKKAALRRGQDYVAGRFNGRWRAEWNETPEAVKFAIIEAAIREAREQGSLTPDWHAAEQVKREKVGPLETEYAVPATASAARPVIGIIDALLAGLTGSTAGAANFAVHRG